MGRYTDGLGSRLRSRRMAESLRPTATRLHRAGVGALMFCSACGAELARSPKGKGISQRAQERAKAAHDRVCRMRHVEPRALVPARAAHAAWWLRLWRALLRLLGV